MIDSETLSFRGYLTGLGPGLRVRSVVEVDGKAWLFNELSHLEERPERTDVYVMDPKTLEIVDRFNLERPFPKWAGRGDDGVIHIFHQVPSKKMWQAGHVSGITQLDISTREERFVATPGLPRVSGMGVYRDRACLARVSSEARGMWCQTDGGEVELKDPQEFAVGVAFLP